MIWVTRIDRFSFACKFISILQSFIIEYKLFSIVINGLLSNLVTFYGLYFLLFIAPCDLSDDDMSIVDTTDGDSITSNGVLMVKDKRSKTGYKKASDRKVSL